MSTAEIQDLIDRATAGETIPALTLWEQRNLDDDPLGIYCWRYRSGDYREPVESGGLTFVGWAGTTDGAEDETYQLGPYSTASIRASGSPEPIPAPALSPSPAGWLCEGAGANKATSVRVLSSRSHPDADRRPRTFRPHPPADGRGRRLNSVTLQLLRCAPI